MLLCFNLLFANLLWFCRFVTSTALESCWKRSRPSTEDSPVPVMTATSSDSSLIWTCMGQSRHDGILYVIQPSLHALTSSIFTARQCCYCHDLVGRSVRRPHKFQLRPLCWTSEHSPSSRSLGPASANCTARLKVIGKFGQGGPSVQYTKVFASSNIQVTHQHIFMRLHIFVLALRLSTYSFSKVRSALQYTK